MSSTRRRWASPPPSTSSPSLSGRQTSSRMSQFSPWQRTFPSPRTSRRFAARFWGAFTGSLSTSTSSILTGLYCTFGDLNILFFLVTIWQFDNNIIWRLREIEAEAHTNTFYKHFYYFVRCQSCHYPQASDWSQPPHTGLWLAPDSDDNDNNAQGTQYARGEGLRSTWGSNCQDLYGLASPEPWAITSDIWCFPE